MLRRRRWKSRRTKSNGGKKRKWLIVSLIFLLFIVQAFIYIDRNLKKPMLHLANVKLTQIATQTISGAITQQLSSNNANVDKLVDWKTNKDGKVTAFTLNYAEHIRITSELIQTLESALSKLETLTEHIPLGQAMGSPIIASFGPNIPIRLEPQGAAKVELSTRNENVGINMLLVEVYAKVTVDVVIVVPFDSEHKIVETEIPISYALVVGDVPAYYFDNKGNPMNGGNKDVTPPNISIPGLNIPGNNAGTSSGTNVQPNSQQESSESTDAH